MSSKEKAISNVGTGCEYQHQQARFLPVKVDSTEADSESSLIPGIHCEDSWYKMDNLETGGSRGMAVIINTHEIPCMGIRSETEEDCIMVSNVFCGIFGFDVKRYDNVSLETMRRALADLASVDHSQSDCFACFVLSHGKDDVIVCSDGETVRAQDIFCAFTESACPSLAGKPKLFFFEVTHDGHENQAYPKHRSLHADSSSVTITTYRTPADLYIFYNRTQGNDSRRDRCCGSLFIQTLCQVLEKDYRTRNFEAMMQTVMLHLAGRNVSPLPVMYSTFRKNLRFVPQEAPKALETSASFIAHEATKDSPEQDALSAQEKSSLEATTPECVQQHSLICSRDTKVSSERQEQTVSRQVFEGYKGQQREAGTDSIETGNVRDSICWLQADSGVIRTDDSDVFRMPEEYPLNVLWYDMGYGNGAGTRGKCVILNFWKFASGDERKGSEKDEERIIQLFGEKLGFDVEVHENLEKQAMLKTLKKLGGEDYSGSRCLCMFVLSHGKDGVIRCSDDQAIQLSEVYAVFDPTFCKGLTDKPKLLFIQACRGVQKDTGVQYDAPVDTYVWSFTRTLPRFADFFVFYATCPGVFSYRNEREGTYFIQTLCEVLERNHHVTDFMKMMTLVNNYVAEQDIRASSAEVEKQMPNFCSTLRKELLFAAPEDKVTMTQPSSAAEESEHAFARPSTQEVNMGDDLSRTQPCRAVAPSEQTTHSQSEDSEVEDSEVEDSESTAEKNVTLFEWFMHLITFLVAYRKVRPPSPRIEDNRDYPDADMNLKILSRTHIEWRPKGIGKLVKLGESEIEYSIDSTKFQLNGYLFGLSVNTSKNQHSDMEICASLCIYSSANDHNLAWPFSTPYTIILHHPTDEDFVISKAGVFSPDLSHTYLRPKTPSNNPVEYVLMPLKKLHLNGYVVNDSLHLSFQLHT